MEILTTGHYDRIKKLFKGAKNNIKIISPFLSKTLADELCEIVKNNSIKCEFITRIYLEDLFVKANNIDAIEKMIKAGIQVYALKYLHTKLYIFDESVAVLGSANFTVSGFKSNIELSLLVDSKEEVQSLELVSELSKYFDDMLFNIKDGIVTEELILKVKKDYNEKIIPYKKENNSSNTNSNYTMYGAVIESRNNPVTLEALIEESQSAKKEKDIVNEIYSSNEPAIKIEYGHSIWMKQMGKGNDRIDPDSLFYPTIVKLNGKDILISTYSENKKPTAIKNGDEIYIAALSKNTKKQNVPIIVGRGYLKKFEIDNRYKEDWAIKNNWLKEYPWYCIIEKCEILNTAIKNCISMDVVWDKLGSDTYESSFGKCESIDKVSKKHYQKAHIKLSGNAKEFIDREFDKLVEKYGVLPYTSEI